MLLKNFVKRVVRASNYTVVDSSVFGVDLARDLRRFCGPSSIETIVDVGANVGQTTTYFKSMFPKARIHSFEPEERCYAELVKNTSGLANVFTYHTGLSSTPGERLLGLGGHSGANSLQLAETAALTQTISLDTLDNVLVREQMASIDVLKLDVEGHELDVLRGAADTLRRGRVRFVYAECVFGPDSDPVHTNFFEIHQMLSKFDFVFICLYSQAFDLTAGSSMGNGLFCLRRELPAAVAGRVRNVV